MKALLKRGELRPMVREEEDRLRELESVRKELDSWLRRRDEPDSYQELKQSRGELVTAKDNIETLEAKLSKLLRKHDDNQETLQKIFSAAVRGRHLQANGYDGKVSLENRELGFRITHGPAMSGEAVETLSVLLADVAALIYSTVNDSTCFPGILVHDSPREADLAVRIYRSFFRFAASLQNHFGDADNCPFQYILTTTTAPPNDLSHFVKLPLDASKRSGLLLKRNISDAADRKNDGVFGTGGDPGA